MEYFTKKHETTTDIPPKGIYVNKIEKRITFGIKREYYFELLIPKTMKLLGITKSKMTKDENGERLPYLEITEVALVRCNISNHYYQLNSRALYTFVPNKSLGQLLDIWPKIFTFLFKNL